MQTEAIRMDGGRAAALDFEKVVEQYYRPLYQFGFSLTGSEADACDLVQQTLYTWRLKGEQLRDMTKIKAWLFTTLHRVFLQIRRRQARFPHYELEIVEGELPPVLPTEAAGLDSEEVLAALEKVDDVFRAPLALFYLDDHPYREIADILGVPIGTVKSRISRGIMRLKSVLGVTGSSGESVTADLAA